MTQDELKVMVAKAALDYIPSGSVLGVGSGSTVMKFIEQIGINSCDEITPDILMKFHKNDRHMTIEGKNTRSSKVRKLLTFMAEEGLIP